MISLFEIINILDIDENDNVYFALDRDAPRWEKACISLKTIKKYLNTKEIKVSKISLMHKIYDLCSFMLIVNGITLEKLKEFEYE